MNRRIEWTVTSGRTSRAVVTEDIEASPLMAYLAAQQNFIGIIHGQQTSYGTALWAQQSSANGPDIATQHVGNTFGSIFGAIG